MMYYIPLYLDCGDWDAYGSMCYKLITKGKKYHTAENKCRHDYGGNLAILDDAALFNWVISKYHTYDCVSYFFGHSHL